MAWPHKPKFTELTPGETETTPAPKKDLWVKCPGCGETLFQKALRENCHVCTSGCGYHFKMPVEDRIKSLFDSQEILFDEIRSLDPLHFIDSKGPYDEKIKKAIKKTGRTEAVIMLEGNIEAHTVTAAFLDFDFLGGSMGSAVGERIFRGMKNSLEKKIPFISFTSSGGARMHEGILSLMQMAKTSLGTALLREACLPFISVLLDPTTGGVTASFAMLGDLNIGEKGALIGFAGPRVIEQTIKQTLPRGFQTSEFLLEKGFLDIVVEREALKGTLIQVLDLLSPEYLAKSSAKTKTS